MNPHYNQNYMREEIDTVLAKIKFCHSLQNTKIGYEYEVLYVFVPQVQLFNAEDEEETVDIYTKFNVIDLPSGNRAVVISFHHRLPVSIMVGGK